MLSRPSVHATRRADRRRALALAGVVAGTLAAAPSAHAGAVEQIDRADGAQGASPFFSNVSTVGTADTGRAAFFIQDGKYWRRDVKTNVTVPASTSAEKVGGVSDDGTKMVVDRQVGGHHEVIVKSFAGLPEKKLTNFNSFSGGWTTRISPDGTKAVAFLGGQIIVFTIATGANVTYDALDYSYPGVRPMSSDASVIATSGVRIVNGVMRRVSNTGIPAVSPNGATIVTNLTSPGGELIGVRGEHTADGVSRTYPFPAGFTGRILWISPDGRKVVSGATDDSATPYAQQLNLDNNQWAFFGGAFSADLEGDLTKSISGQDEGYELTSISGNGRYATIGYGDEQNGEHQSHAALVDLTNGALPGEQEAYSASTFFPIDRPICGAAAQALKVRLGQPANFIPVPRSGTLVISFDGVEKFRKTWSAPVAKSAAGSVAIPAGALSVTVTATAVDDRGRTVTQTTTAPTSSLCRYTGI